MGTIIPFLGIIKPFSIEHLRTQVGKIFGYIWGSKLTRITLPISQLGFSVSE